MSDEKREHEIAIACGGKEVARWESYEIQVAMNTPAARWTLRRPFDNDAWKLLRLDAEVRVYIDSVPILVGYIDRRKKRSKEHEIEIGGADKAGRLVAESAPAINYDGLELSEIVKRLVDPWFPKVTLSDARNRRVRTGKGFKVAGGAEPVYVHRVVHRAGKVHPGQSRWQAISELCADAGLAAWGTADGSEFFIGQPNQQQAAQYAIRLGKTDGTGVVTTAKELDYEEDIGDGYSVIAVVGTGGGTEQDFGENVSSRRGVLYDFATPDGTGGDFLRPKRLLMPERQFDSNQDALEVARREQARRNFRRRIVTATMPLHGQFLSAGGEPTLFAPNTIAYVVDEDFDPPLRGDYLVFACTYSCDRQGGETTVLEMVPRGTEFVL